MQAYAVRLHTERVVTSVGSTPQCNRRARSGVSLIPWSCRQAGRRTLGLELVKVTQRLPRSVDTVAHRGLYRLGAGPDDLARSIGPVGHDDPSSWVSR